MKKNITLGVLALITFLLFAAGLTQKNMGTLWMIVSMASFIVFLFLIYKIVVINFPPKK